MKRVVSFSIWGTDPAFVHGAIANKHLAERYYPGWDLWIYVGHDVPIEHAAALAHAGFTVILCQRPSPQSWAGLFWRFSPAFYPNVDAFISRDCDSRLNPREAAAVNEWLGTAYTFHAMRDHYQHIVPILGGMWGCRHAPWLKDALDAWSTRTDKGTDQDFLAQRVWPKVRNDCLVHDKYTCDTPLQINGTTWTYKPQEFFGDQILRSFPNHAPLDPAIHGEHVGARVGV